MILMGIELDSIKDPRLRQTITDSLMGAVKLKEDLAKEIPKPDEPLEIGKDGIQAQIKEWCANQWPEEWVVDNPRSDRKSTVPQGRHDMTIYAPKGKVYNVEVKRKGEKLKPKQIRWKAKLNTLGHAVYVVHSLQEFLEVVAPSPPSPPSPPS